MKKIIQILAVMLLSINVFTFRVNADIGPKPAVYVELEGQFSDDWYLVVFGQKDKSYGPNQPLVYDVEHGYNNYENYPEELLQPLLDYKDPEGYVIWNMIQQIGNKEELHWTYYAPDNFKLGLYDSSTGKIILSEIIERDTFNGYYKLTYSNGQMTVTSNYNYLAEFGKLALRMVATVIIELLFALIFGYREQDQIRRIIITNLVTQLLLNGAVTLFVIWGGSLSAFLLLIPMEVVVFIIEGIVYHKGLGPHPFRNWMYSLTANLASWFIGMFLLFM